MNEANVSNTSVIVHRRTRGLQIMKGLGSISSKDRCSSKYQRAGEKEK